MRTKTQLISSFLFFFLHLNYILPHSQAQPSINGVGCTANQTSNSCQTYAFYRAMPPNFLDLSSIGDLFSVSRLMISEPSNISSPESPLIPYQPLFVPISCSCNSVNSTTYLSYSNLSYTIKKDDNFYLVSTIQFQNLTNFEAVETVNPTLIPTTLDIGQKVIFPVLCKCPNQTQLQNQVNFLISYVFQPSDNLSEVASSFGAHKQAVIDANGYNIQPFDTIFILVNRLPPLSQPVVFPSVPLARKERKGLITGLAVGLGICGILLILVSGIWVFRAGEFKRKQRIEDEKQMLQLYNKGLKEMETNLMADVSDCLDKYTVFNIEQLKEATDGFDEKFLIQGSVYKGFINGEDYAIKKMKWNAYEELKILQKVNHGNLVKLEGFCIDSDDASCYLLYEYIGNGSLHSWLHSNRNEKPNWKTRLRIAIDIANGLQYIHEHTIPKVVHKDINSSNILLDLTMRAKIANFGLAKSGCNAITMHVVGTQGYVAPECLTDRIVSTKMDVFSFGIMLLELISGKEAIDEEGNALWAKVGGVWDGNGAKKKTALKMWLDESLLHESFSLESVLNVMTIAVACVHKDPAKRPCMVDVVYALCKSDDLFFDISENTLTNPRVMAR